MFTLSVHGVNTRQHEEYNFIDIFDYDSETIASSDDLNYIYKTVKMR